MKHILLSFFLVLPFSLKANTYCSNATTMNWGATGCITGGNWKGGCSTAGFCIGTGGPHTITVSSGHTVTHDGSSADWPTVLSGAYTITVNGTLTLSKSTGTHEYVSITLSGTGATLNVTAGTYGPNSSNTTTITVNSGCTLNVSGGTLRVAQLIVEAGGVVNLSGGTIANTLTSSSGVCVNVKNGTPQGKIVVSSTGKFSNAGSGTICQLDGIIDFTSTSTPANSTLGALRVTNNTSTGRLRLATGQRPGLQTGTSTNFTGENSGYGGTVEYYGSGPLPSISCCTFSQYYDLEVNTSSHIAVDMDITVVGVLRLKAGSLRLNSSTARRLTLRGTVAYTGSNCIQVASAARIEVTGSLGNFSSGVSNSGNISSQGSTVNVYNPELRLSSSTTWTNNSTTASMLQLRVFREDVVHLRAATTIGTSGALHVKCGKLRVYSSLEVQNSNPDSVQHSTVGAYSSTYGYVSGPLTRAVAANNRYDFPVGRTGATMYYYSNNAFPPTIYGQHRLLSLDIRAMSGISKLTVSFSNDEAGGNPNANCASGLIPPTEYGQTYLSMHTEGVWIVNPDAFTSIDYDAYCYIHGFGSLADNTFGALKRPSASSSCSDWDIYGGELPAMGDPGRVRGTALGTTFNGYALRLNWSDFSQIGIGIMDIPTPVEWQSFTIKAVDNSAELNWHVGNSRGISSFEVQRGSSPADMHKLTTLPVQGLDYRFVDTKPLAGLNYYRIRALETDGSVSHSQLLSLDFSATRSFALYPNPSHASGTCTASLPLGSLSLQVFSPTGQQLHSWDVRQRSTYEFSLPAGVYIVRLRGDGLSETRQLVVD